jgi:hypothetical protein
MLLNRRIGTYITRYGYYESWTLIIKFDHITSKCVYNICHYMIEYLNKQIKEFLVEMVRSV